MFRELHHRKANSDMKVQYGLKRDLLLPEDSKNNDFFPIIVTAMKCGIPNYKNLSLGWFRSGFIHIFPFLKPQKPTESWTSEAAEFPNSTGTF